MRKPCRQAEKIVNVEAKHSIASAARLDRAAVDGDAATVRPLNWIARIQPVPLDALGTWHVIERAVVDSIKDKNTFSETFKSLAVANGFALLKLFQQSHTFDWLLCEIGKMNATTMISELIVSPERAARRVGLALFDKVGSRQIAKRPLKKASDEIIQIVFYELQCLVLEPKATAMLMWSIKPRFEQMGNEMLGEYVDLLEIQVRNYPGNASGIELYERRVQSQSTKVGDNVRLKFERWNLTTIVERVESSLLSPALLPQKFFSQFSYICSQVAGFDHGSDEWENQVIPNWRSFLDGLFAGDADERSVRLLPVALIILKDSADKRETAETGWIDLIEWGMLAIWEVARKAETKGIRNLVALTWIDFYVKELERYYHTTTLSIYVSRKALIVVAVRCWSALRYPESLHIGTSQGLDC